MHRRCEGLGLWRIGFDGTMTWAYTHNSPGLLVRNVGTMPDPANQNMYNAAVFRLSGGVLDTPWWEGFRKGVDDMRYFETLQALLRRVAGHHPEHPLIAQTHDWLAELDVSRGDLDSIRRQMAERVVALSEI